MNLDLDLDLESALEQEEAKVLNAQNEIQHIRQEFDRRLQEKDEVSLTLNLTFDICLNFDQR